jgi:hypothetical protein
MLFAASCAAIAGLAVAADLTALPLVDLADLRTWEGKAVAVEAVATRAAPAGAGAQVLTLADGSGQALAFWPAGEPVEGARVRAEGGVERVRGQWELRAWQVEVLAPADAPWTAAQAARLAPALAGRAIAVLGEVRWPPDGPAEVADDGATLPVRGLPDALALLLGERALVRGALRYEPAEARYVLEAWEVARA